MPRLRQTKAHFGTRQKIELSKSRRSAYAVMHRDAAEYTEASQSPDMAASCDTQDDMIAEIIAELMPMATTRQVRQAAELFAKVASRLANAGVDAVSSRTQDKIWQAARSVIVSCIYPRPNLAKALAASYAFDLGLHKGKPMAEVATANQLERAALSAHAKAFARLHQLPPSKWSRDQEAGKSSRAARNRVLTNNAKTK